MSISPTKDAPHIRHHENTRMVMGDVLLTMLFLYAMAYYYYGVRVAVLGLISVGTAVICDFLCVVISRRKVNIRDWSPIVTGLLLPLLMPASIPYYVVVLAAAFAIIVAKHPFGGVGHNVFNPAAAGFSFVAICYPELLFTYPQPLQKLEVLGIQEIIPATSPAFTIEIGGVPQLDLIEMLLGNFPGPMGATNILVILACLLYLVFRRTIHWEVPLAFFITAGVYALLFPRMGNQFVTDFASRVSLMLYELMSGMLLLGGVYMFGDPVTTPKRDWSKIGFAITAGLAVMLFRRYGGFEEEFTFAVLLMNATVWGFDMLGEHVASFFRRRRSV